MSHRDPKTRTNETSDDEISHSIDSSFIKLRKWIIDNINARKILIRDEITHQWIIKTKVSLQGVC